ncbi:MAG TPA: cation:proton antiporter [Solirubrobacterales bacterium]|nr:cation:proton antiporter [Solirubrobacterales bacterium]
MEIDLSNLLVVAGVAVLAPVLADLSRRARLPTVVAEIFLGILVGPELLGLAELDGILDALSTFGLAFLFFLAGIEIDFERIRGAPARAGALGWLLSVVLGGVVALALHLSGVIHATVLVALALTTTTLGTLMPILRDSGVLDQRFGRFVVGAGTAGEFGPIVLVSVILAFDADEPLRATLLFAFAAIVVVATVIAVRARPARVVRLLQTTMGTSGQLAVRLSLLLVIALAALAAEFGLDVILGAFAAGILVGIVIRDSEAREFLGKLDAVGYGFLIPVFFITTGMGYDLDALGEDPATLLMVPGFTLLFLVVRGLPAMLLYRKALPRPDRIALALFSAAALPLLVAITQIGLDTHTMRSEVAVSLIGAGMLSVLIYPLLALLVHRRGERVEPPG